MAANVTDEENWFGQTNKYKYQDLMIAIYEKDVIDIKAAHKKLGGTGVWIDTSRFTKGKRLHNPAGLYHLFGEYSGQGPNEVRDLMIGWIYDNYNNVKSWTRMAMQHKNIELDSWIEKMQKATTEGDDISLYILARMYNKHVFVHDSKYGWSTLPYRVEDNYTDIVSKCDLELVYLKNWVFGEVKKIRAPVATPDADGKITKKPKESKGVITGNVTDVNVITHNVPKKSDRALRKQVATVQKKMTERKSTRKRQNIDYSQFAAQTDELSPPRKRRKPNLLRKPSKTVLEARKKRKMMSPLSAGQTATTMTKKTQVHVSCTESKASTSTPTVEEAEPPTIGTLTVDATEDETKTAIAALLSLSQDIPPPDDDLTAENAALVPLNPNINDTIAYTSTAPTSSNDPSVIKPVSVPVHKRFVTKEYKLKRKYRRPRKFPCAKCGKCFSTQKEANCHFKDTHPPVKCDFCDRFFSCPASMLKHRYSHFETMMECETCGKGFQFQSQLKEHLCTHQTIGDWVCFKPQCGKRFKQESELDAHLFKHRTTKQKCDQCAYENPDPRNLRAHKRKHSDIKSFICKICGQAFMWVEQRRRHLKNNKCPGPPK